MLALLREGLASREIAERLALSEATVYLVIADDLARLSPPGRTALRHAHERFEREGVPLDRLRACQDEHRAGTSLPGCLRVYLPDWDGDWRMIFRIATDEAGPLLSYLGGGVGQPRGTRAPDAYQIAHHRLHGRWPRRRLSGRHRRRAQRPARRRSPLRPKGDDTHACAPCRSGRNRVSFDAP